MRLYATISAVGGSIIVILIALTTAVLIARVGRARAQCQNVQVCRSCQVAVSVVLKVPLLDASSVAVVALPPSILGYVQLSWSTLNSGLARCFCQCLVT